MIKKDEEENCKAIDLVLNLRQNKSLLYLNKNKARVFQLLYSMDLIHFSTLLLMYLSFFIFQIF